MSPPSSTDLAHLFVNVARLHRTRADQVMDRIGLYSGQAVLLSILSRQDGLTHSQVADKLEISPAAATKVIKRMVQAGYLRRQVDPSDERVSRVYLEEQGRTVSAEVNRTFGELDSVLFQDLSVSDLELLRDLLTRMRTSLQRWQP